MNLSNPFRAELSGIPYLNDFIDPVLAKINALWNVQHKGDGTHSAITADSVTTVANAEGATGDIDGDGAINMTGTDASSVGGDFSAQTGTSKTTIGLVGSITANDGALGPGVNMGSKMVAGESEDGSGNRRWSLTDLVNGMTPFIVRRFSGDYYVQPGPVSRAAGMVANLGNPNDSFSKGWWDAAYVVTVNASTVTADVITVARSGSGTKNVPNATATTLFAVSATGLYQVYASYGSVGYHAQAQVGYNGSGATLFNTDTGTASFVLSLSGTDVQITQTSGGTLNGVAYTYLRIG